MLYNETTRSVFILGHDTKVRRRSIRNKMDIRNICHSSLDFLLYHPIQMNNTKICRKCKRVCTGRLCRKCYEYKPDRKRSKRT